MSFTFWARARTHASEFAWRARNASLDSKSPARAMTCSRVSSRLPPWHTLKKFSIVTRQVSLKTAAFLSP